MNIDDRLKELGIELPVPPPAVGTYAGAIEHGGFLYVSGHGPYRDGEYLYRGKVDSEVTVESAQEAAELTIINALGTAKNVLGSLDRVVRIVKLFGMVNSDPDFAAQPKVIDGASDFLVKVFGDKGRHARSAVGLGALPMRICVEIEMILAIQ